MPQSPARPAMRWVFALLLAGYLRMAARKGIACDGRGKCIQLLSWAGHSSDQRTAWRKSYVTELRKRSIERFAMPQSERA